MRKIGIALTTWNRRHATINSMVQVMDDERIDEIVITDDASRDTSYGYLKDYFKGNPKVKLFQNERQLNCYANKHRTMQNATSEWCILFDSDNLMNKDYIDALYAIPEWDSKTIYNPEFLMPHFDFRKWSGLTLTKENIAEYSKTDLMISCNAMNNFMNRQNYLDIWDGSVDAGTSDSIYVSYCHLVNGGKIHITPNLYYIHSISDSDSGHYQVNNHLYRDFHEDLMVKIKNLK